nr:zinc finger, CCHC-type, retrotransposon Gag domain protein [Tanacetum cinerariifolium]
MVNTRTDADLSAAVQHTLQTLLPQIREEIREEFRTGYGSSNATIMMVNTRTDADLSAAVQTPCRHCFPRFAQRFARSSVPVLDRRMLVDIPHRLLFILGLNALTSKSPIPLRRRQLPWTRRIGSLTLRRSLMSWVRFLRLAGFLGAATGTEEEQVKNFQWGLRRSTLNHLMFMSYTDVAQV